MSLGPLRDAVATATDDALALVPRLRERDHTMFGDDPDEIADRLGWLDAPARGREVSAELERLAADVIADGITDVVLVGMGGSSLYPEVLTRVHGPAAGHPRLRVLDSTDPAALDALEREVPWAATLLVPASKSGTTLETTCHLDRLLERLRDVHGEHAGRFVVPITDPGSPLDARAAAEGFRTVVHGDPDVGGRFAALTPFGLWPAALLGIDLDAHLATAEAQLDAGMADDASRNAPAALGAILAAAHRVGRDKLILLLPDEVAAFGGWLEQLIAESTGKQGKGIVPLLGDAPDPETATDDRVVVALGEHPEAARLASAGVPVVSLPWEGPAQLPGEVVRFEVATAIAGALLGINPFDQPDVAAAKTATADVLERGEQLPATEDPAALLERVRPGADYVALLGYVTPDGDDEVALHAAAARLRDRLGAPVTVGIGPRYLHSTGQLHKGGPDEVVALIVVGDDPVDVAIPGRDHGFSRLKHAQAAGDLAALRAVDRRIAHVDLATIDSLGR